ncbi:MAG: hypothetical protein M0R47_16575 [Methylobacter sp.]|uniref:hypothetical protein n=1 Tax=Methylobacter sp. TaxID=2051955 RepID=UPI0025F07B72|nr:hypothetical protein [Methylobacter sp.]MCK9622137.1 hypothetical protein [Methylobacter sp.]
MVEIAPEQDAGAVKRWFSELDDAKKRDESYRKEGKRIIDIYTGTKKVPFNILYSNTDTLLPALYSAVPRPVVRHRFKDTAPLAQAAAKAGERMLEYLLDTNTDGYETFDDSMNSATLDAMLPGRGVTRIKYDAEIGEYGIDSEAEEDIESGDSGIASEISLRKESELVCTDTVCWDRVLFGYSKKWSEVPWIAFEEIIDKAEAERLFGKEMAGKIQFTKEGDDTENDSGEEKQDEHQGERKTATIYQIWDKSGGKKVRYVSKHYKDGFLKVEDDPLELAGFFPMPRPIVLFAKSNDMSVTAPYLVYESQAKEINELTVRIQKIVRAIKARGVYDSELKGDIANLLSGDDNEMIPAEKSATIAADNGFDKSIWFWPVEKLIVVLRELYAAREEAKQVIYEVTGISDIIRGSTVASETASAQQLKSQWGTMRLKRNQGEVQRYARDLLRLMLEVAATKFSADTWAQMTGLPYATDQEVVQSQAVMQAAQQMQMQGMQPNEAQQGMIQQAQAVMQKQTWSQVLDLLKNDMQRSYKIDIETNSTILPEAVEDQKQIAEVMTALGEYLQGVAPLIEKGAFPFEAAKAMMLSVVRRYQFGDEIEEYINQMQPPQPPQDATQQDKQAELQAKQDEQQANIQLEKLKLEMQRLIAEGEAKTQMHLEQMRIESAEKIAKYQADLQAQTQLQIAAMTAANQPQSEAA